jgi:hypothetical protein
MGMKRLIAFTAFMALAAAPAMALSGENSSMGAQGMKMQGHGTMMQGQGTMQGQGMQSQGMAHGGPDMMKLGSRVYRGKLGRWNSEARIIDMKAQMKAAGMPAQGGMMNSHHLALALTDRKTKAPITEGTGSVTVIGPDRSMNTYDLMGMQGHFGADVNLPKPGKYTFNTKIESGGKTGTATFHYTVK